MRSAGRFGRIVAAVAAVLATAALPDAGSVVLAQDPAADTSGTTAAVDRDEAVDILTVSYERTGTIATFTIEVVDGEDVQPEAEHSGDLEGALGFSADGCDYHLDFRGQVFERCDGRKWIGVGRVRADLGVRNPHLYRLTIDLAEVWERGHADALPGHEAHDLWAGVERRGLTVHGVVVGFGCGFCSGQHDEVDGVDSWTM